MNRFHINSLDVNNNIKIHYAHINILDMNNNVQIKVRTNQAVIILRKTCNIKLMLKRTSYPIFASHIIYSLSMSLVALSHIFESTTYVDH